ncbi:hypothetical protein OXB_2844 [Bacillus sp. OxB-1]|uniref:hypothetical protein n=1 Tax=Bacillus sp. (strain OxB-1) TaxID=98228 RepID=UPI000581E80E|nr:hypothetical protein [Bacillus sp. OxB-1]BAQ11315.1 hypothetical protein OXB_2844 [Bacillus sp. OxB-1]
MNYLIVVANGEMVTNRRILGVHTLTTYDERVYVFRDATGAVLFSAPFDSVVYIEQV